MIEYSNRLKALPPYLFAQMEKLQEEKRNAGVDMISFGIGDPDLPTPLFIRKALAHAAMDTSTHNYSSAQGEKEFREAVSEWMKKRFNVDVDSEKQVCALIGSKEGIANIGRAFINPGDKVLCPDPAYPVYAQGSTILCDGVPIRMPLLEKNHFLPELSKFHGTKAKMIYANYPNNPIGAVASEGFMKELAEFSQKEHTVLCYDNAYSEFTFDDYQATSILEHTESAIEFHSLSKTFCMTGDRIGFAVGDARLIEGLRKVKSQIDSGNPVYIQKAAIAALSSYTGKKRPKEMEELMQEYAKRRDVMVDGLRELGFDAQKPKGTFYLWLRLRPEDGKSLDFVTKMINVGVALTPGSGFGEHGEGYVRFALTQPIPRIEEALARMKKVLA